MRRALLPICGIFASACITSSAGSTSEGWRPFLQRHGIKDERLLRAMDKVRRSDFLPASVRALGDEDRPLPIGYDQTTSQPSLIAMMIAALQLQPGCHALEVGTGSGYQTAILGELCEKVASIEIVAPLAERAAVTLRQLGYTNVKVKAGDGYVGWPEEAPFDGIVVSASAAKVPAPLIAQLKAGGRIVIPVGEGVQGNLRFLTKQADGGHVVEESWPVSFVPLTGKHADQDRRK